MLDLKNILKQENILMFIVIFVLLKYGIKEIKLLVFIIVSIGCIYYYRMSYNTYKKHKKDNSNIKIDIEQLLGKIKKYDNNNLLDIVKNNISDMYKLFNKSNRLYMKNDIDSILYIKNNILEYINSLNIQYDDNIIDQVVVGIKSILEKDIEKFKNSINDNLYSRMFNKIEGYSK